MDFETKAQAAARVSSACFEKIKTVHLENTFLLARHA